MAVNTDLDFASVDELRLDPLNPRLGRHRMSRGTPQDDLLSMMREWVLDELALSYLESGGFWSHEPLIVVKEDLYGEECLVVVEGNRRLAALKSLKLASEGSPLSMKWEQMLAETEIPEGLFEKVPYVIADTRLDVQAFLGFRHVTGIKQWDADEKAGFIAGLIDEYGLTYQQVARKIGSKTPTVRKHYIAYRTLLQAEDTIEDFDAERADKRFAILYMSLATSGAQSYLRLNLSADPEHANRPIPEEHLNNLAHFCRWLFGNDETPRVVSDTRQVSDFGTILESEKAVKYLEETKVPKFEVAFRISGGDEAETIRYVMEAANNVELALMRAHAFKGSPELQKAVHRLGEDTFKLLETFPDIRDALTGGEAK